MARRPWTDEDLARRLSHPGIVAGSLAATATLSVLFEVWRSLVTSDSTGIFRSQLAFTVDRFEAVTRTWDIAEFIRMTATLDFVYPVAYGTAIAATWAAAARPSGWVGSTWPIAVAALAVVADWLENLFHLIAIGPVVTGDPTLALAVALGSLFAAMKWGAIVVAVGATATTGWKRGGFAWRSIGVALALLAAAIAGLVVSLAV